jgi:hypothetical protein
MADNAQLIVLFCATALVFATIILRDRQRDRRLRDAPVSGHFMEAAAASVLMRKFDPLVRGRCEIFLPVGDGRYLARVDSRLRKKWVGVLEQWMRRGATINVIVSSPSEEAHRAWQPLKNAARERLNVILLDRERAPTPEIARKIACLDTFHPIILVEREGRGAMWLERNHPVGSTIAYNIDYVAPDDVGHDKRFAECLSVLRDLTTASPFAERLETADKTRAPHKGACGLSEAA